MTAEFPTWVDGAPLADGARAPRGFGVFDTQLRSGGVRLRADRHLARLRAACARFGLDVGARDVDAEIARYAATLGAEDALIRTIVVRDDASGAVVLAVEARAPRVVPADGVELLLVEARVDPLGAWKTTIRAARTLHAERAERAGCFDALLALPGGAVVEAARANVYAVVGGRALTPPRAAGCLPGVVRGVLLERSIGLEEAELDLDLLRRADEIWISSSGLRVAPVRAVRGLRDDLPGAGGTRWRIALDALRASERDPDPV